MISDVDVGTVLHRLLENVDLNETSANINVPVDLTAAEIRYLCKTASEIFLKESTLLQVEAPIQICGNICGQFTDLVRLLDRGGYPPIARYLFLGGYVNRGTRSLETICLLLIYKILYPDRIYMLRGSHETEMKASQRGLRTECEVRALSEIWPDLMHLFDCLPLAALVNDRLFCCYGGPPSTIESLDEILAIQRPLRAPFTEKGIPGDLLYSKTNPHDPGRVDLERGCLYGRDVVRSFVERFDIKSVCRAKQVVMDGYELFADSAELITLFSVPNYRDKYMNDGAVMQLSDTLTVSFLIMEAPNNEIANPAADNHFLTTNDGESYVACYQQTLKKEPHHCENGQTQQECS